MTTVLVIGKTPDQLLIRAFEALEKEFGKDDWGFNGESDYTQSIDFLKGQKGSSYLLNSAHIRPTNTNAIVNFRRTHNGQFNAYYDEIVIEPNRRAPGVEAVFRIEEILRSVLSFPRPSAKIQSDSQIVGVLEKEVASIASMHHKLLEDALELKKTYELQEAERRSQWEEEKRQAEAAVRENEKASLERIAAEKLELDEKIKEFDFSDHMRARRALREQITDEVQSSLSRPISSYSSTMKLAIVTTGTLVAIGGAGFFAFESFESFIALAKSAQVTLTVADPAAAPTTPPDNTYLLWMLAIRGFVLSAVAVGFTYYLVSMFRNSHEEEIRTMRELQRYGMDINRASWIIETAMEMTTKENAKIPDQWIEGACAGLFQSGTVKDAEVNSLAALGAVLGLGPEIEAGPDGLRMRLNRKASRQAAKEGE